MKELPVNLKALDPSREVDPSVLLIANRRKRECTVIGAEVRLEAITARVVVREKGI